MLWANLHLPFWLSLMPFATGYMGENGFAPTTALYAVDLAMCAVASTILVVVLFYQHGAGTDFARALGSDRKGKISLRCYVAAIPMAFYNERVALTR